MAHNKTIYFIRHAQSQHNVFEEANCHKPDYHDPYFFDSDLSALGEEQIKGLPASVAEFIDTVQLVVVSPFRRALKTCLSSFSPPRFSVLAHPECREQVTNACDIGTPTSQLKAMYPQLDWSLLQHEIWWYLDEKSASEVTVNNYQEHFRSHRYEEPEDVLGPRVAGFREWITLRPETVIVVVAHSNFIKAFLGMSEKLANCEVYKYTM